MSPRVSMPVFLAAALALAACSEDDTIVSLNVNSTNVGAVSKLHVDFNQSGKTFATDVVPPTQDGGDAGPVIDSAFFERITMPDGWPSGDATITVTGFDGAGAPLQNVTIEPVVAEVKEGETVAAYVELEGPEPPPEEPPAETGAAGAAGAGSAGAGTGGASAATGGAAPAAGAGGAAPAAGG